MMAISRVGIGQALPVTNHQKCATSSKYSTARRSRKRIAIDKVECGSTVP
jgi:hypothetical protein